MAALSLIVAAGAAQAAGKAALVIGNGAYRSVTPLANPANDAQDMAAALTRVGYAVTLVTDGDLAAMNDGLRAFLRNADRADSALVFYSGHGVQVNGKNYLIPVSARIEDELDLDTQALSLDKLLDLVDRAAPRVRIVILDSCRDNPLTRTLVRGAGTRGLARVDLDAAAAKGTLIAFATAPGSVARDGDGRNSPFTKALLAHLETPNLDVRLLFGAVRQDVDAATQGSQTPWVNEAIIGSFSLDDGGTPAQPPVQPAIQAQPQVQPAVQAEPQLVTLQPPAQERPLTIDPTPAMPANPSFSCNGRLNAVEQQICASPVLADLDRTMASSYTGQWRALAGAERKRFADVQLRWIAERDACGGDAACLEARYRERLASLGLAASGFAAQAYDASADRTQPSFPCNRNLTAVEARICASPLLAGLDRRMAAAYGQQAAALGDADRKLFATDQKRWAARRNACRDDACLVASYRQRLSELGVP
ncbi:caspase family protein [Labrys wisconsinensis]|uniref:Caspase family p20 domain-containing protein n=1 Tax=Labrys wisconsinensis TaxID=425677 RepID=A0ABU0JF56_9HYPH|nr:caspase family protein [Labrys wisconsinensis]MDQ0472915.1 uncharacterized protein [Labrys wisconsinensis]